MGIHSIIMNLEGLSREQVLSLEVPTGVPIVYQKQEHEWTRLLEFEGHAWSFLRQKNGLILAFCLHHRGFCARYGLLLKHRTKRLNLCPHANSLHPNCAHLGENDVYRMDENTSVIINQPVEQVWQKALDYVDDSRTSILYESGNDSNGHYIHFVEKTIFWRIRDDVFIAVIPLVNNLARLNFIPNPELDRLILM